MPRSAPGSEGTKEMTFDYLLAAAVMAGLLGYLGYALVRPERF
jgi:K+-transporting ATPase KdpF subunit